MARFRTIEHENIDAHSAQIQRNTQMCLRIQNLNRRLSDIERFLAQRLDFQPDP